MSADSGQILFKQPPAVYYCDMSAVADSTTIFRRVIDPEKGSMSSELARFVMALDFPPPDHQRFECLSEKAQEGTLSPEEAAELDGYLHVDTLLAILRLKAQRSLDGPDLGRGANGPRP